MHMLNISAQSGDGAPRSFAVKAHGVMYIPEHAHIASSGGRKEILHCAQGSKLTVALYKGDNRGILGVIA